MRTLTEKQKFAIAKAKKEKEEKLNAKLLTMYRKIDRTLAKEIYNYIKKYNIDIYEINFGYEAFTKFTFEVFKFFITNKYISWDLISADENISEQFKMTFSDKVVEVVKKKKPKQKKKKNKKEIIEITDIFGE